MYSNRYIIYHHHQPSALILFNFVLCMWPLFFIIDRLLHCDLRRVLLFGFVCQPQLIHCFLLNEFRFYSFFYTFEHLFLALPECKKPFLYLFHAFPINPILFIKVKNQRQCSLVITSAFGNAPFFDGIGAAMFSGLIDINRLYRHRLRELFANFFSQFVDRFLPSCSNAQSL